MRNEKRHRRPRKLKLEASREMYQEKKQASKNPYSLNLCMYANMFFQMKETFVNGETSEGCKERKKT